MHESNGQYQVNMHGPRAGWLIRFHSHRPTALLAQTHWMFVSERGVVNVIQKKGHQVEVVGRQVGRMCLFLIRIRSKGLLP